MRIRYWRNKARLEIDFVLAHSRDRVDAVECKWNSAAFDSASLAAFRKMYPHGRNFLVTPAAGPALMKTYGNLEVQQCSPAALR